MNVTVYLAGPINGRSDAECINWRKEAARLWPGQVLDPMRRDYRGREHESVADIVEQDKRDIYASDALLVYFDRPSVGTAMEVLLAHQYGIPVVVVDRSGAALSPWLIYHSHAVVENVETACRLLEQWLTRKE